MRRILTEEEKRLMQIIEPYFDYKVCGLVENAPVASIAFAVGNPDCSPKIMYEAMDRGINCILYICEKQGIKLLFSQLAKFSKSKLLDKHGFYRGAKSVWERFRIWD